MLGLHLALVTLNRRFTITNKKGNVEFSVLVMSG